MAAGRYLSRAASHRHRVVIGKDTRLSGYMIETGADRRLHSQRAWMCSCFGPVPTPAVAMLTRSLRADLGVMISASHNPFDDNGIKIFGPDGYKLSDDAGTRDRSTDRQRPSSMALPVPTKIGRAKRIEDAQARYIEFAKRTYPTRQLTLDGLRIVIDTRQWRRLQVGAHRAVGTGRRDHPDRQ